MESDFISLVPAIIRNDIPYSWGATSMNLNRNFIISVYFTETGYDIHHGRSATVVLSNGEIITVEDRASIETLLMLVVGR